MGVDAYSDIVVQRLLMDPTINVDANSSSVDRDGFEGLGILVSLGPETDTLGASVHIQVELEESDNDSTWNDVADVDVRNPVTGDNTGTILKADAAAEVNKVYQSAYLGNKRYVRAVANMTGTHTTGLDLQIFAIKTRPRLRPANS